MTLERGASKMDKQKIDMYIAANAKFFEPTALPLIKQKLEKLTDDDYLTIQSLELKDPTILLIISVFLGTLGIDRFMIGDTGMGILKLLTSGLCGILWLIDIFTISKKVKQLNFAKFQIL